MYFAFAVIGAALILIPKTQYKKFFLYGLLFGGLGDSIIALLLHLSGLIRYSNMGVTSVLGIFSFWTPITWAFAFMIFFYFLPFRKSFLIPYLILFVALNYSLGLVMENLGLFEYRGFYRYIAPIVFLLWYLVSALVFIRNEHNVKI
jgi:hypothetical protein